MEDYSVRPVNRGDIADLVLNVHYAGRWPSVSFAYGLYRGGEIVGAVTYGTPPSAPLRSGIAGSEFSGNVLELNRLVLSDNRRNEASFLISRSLRMLGGDRIIVSFADISEGHNGCVYRASNFLYCGLSAKRTNWKVRGREHLHGQTIADEFRGVANRSEKMREKYGDDFYLEDRPRKHRYIFISGSKSFKKKAERSLKYPPIAFTPSGVGRV